MSQPTLYNDVFISYSRRDIDFARSVVARLEDTARDSWVDWGDLSQGAQWWPGIQQGIDSADNFVLLMTPASLASPVCHLEIAHARARNKRIIPVVRIESPIEMALGAVAAVKPDATLNAMLAGRDLLLTARDNWQVLSEIQWIYFREQDDFDNAFETLVRTIETDQDHVKAHTRLGLRAREWEDSQHDSSLLLRGAELRDAEIWLAASAGKRPAADELHHTYIQASRAQHEHDEAQQRRSNRLIRLLALGAGLLALVAVVVAWGAVGSQNHALAESTRAADNRATSDANAATALFSQGQEATARVNSDANAATATFALGEAQAAQATSVANAEQAATQAARAQANADLAGTQAAIAEQNAAVSQSLSLAEAARQALAQRDPRLALALALEANRMPDPPALAQRVLAEAAYAPGVVREIPIPAGQMVFDPSGTRLLLRNPRVTLLSWPAAQPIWSIDDLEFSVGLGASPPVFTPDGSLILIDLSTGAVFGGDTRVSEDVVGVLDAASGEVLQRFALPRVEGFSIQMVALGFDQALQRVYAAFRHGRVTQDDSGPQYRGEIVGWELASGEQVVQLELQTDYLPAVAFTRDGKRALYEATSPEDFGGTLTLIDLESGAAVREYDLSVLVGSLVISPDAKLAMVGAHGSAVVWSLESGETIYSFRRSTSSDSSGPGVNNVAFSPLASYALFLSRYDDTLSVLDIARREVVFAARASAAAGAAFSPDGAAVLSASWIAAPLTGNNALAGEASGSILVWNIEADDAPRLLPGSNLAFTTDGAAVRLSLGDQFWLFDPATGRITPQAPSLSDLPEQAVLSPDGRLLLAKIDDHTLELRDAQAQRVLHTLQTTQRLSYPDPIFSPDGALFAAIVERANEDLSLENQIMLWEVESGASPGTFEVNYPCAIAFSSDSRLVLTGANRAAEVWTGSRVLMYDTVTGAQVREFPLTDYIIYALAFSPDGASFLVAAGDPLSTTSSVTLRDASDGQVLQSFDGHSGAVNALAFLPASPHVLTGGEDGTLRLWDLDTGLEIQRLVVDDAVKSFLLSPDGQHALVATTFDRVLVQIRPPETLKSWIRANRHVTALTCEEREVYAAQPLCIDGTPAPEVVAAPTIAPATERAGTPPPDMTAVAFEVSLAALTEAGLIPENSGRLTDLVREATIDLSGDDNSIRWLTLNRPYGDFALSAIVRWGPGEREDSCGFAFRYADNDHFYTLEIDRLGFMKFSGDLNADEKVAAQYGDGSAIRTGRETMNQLALLALGDTFRVYVNGLLAGEFSDPAHRAGLVGLLGGTGSRSDQSSCTFYNTSVWDMSAGSSFTPTPAPTAAPTMTPLAAGEAVAAGLRGRIRFGQGQVWTYEGSAGDTLTIRVNADLPAVRDQERSSEGLDTYVLLYGPDGSLLKDNDDRSSDPHFTDSLIETFVLPEDGVYRIEVRDWDNDGEGDYTLILETQR